MGNYGFPHLDVTSTLLHPQDHLIPPNVAQDHEQKSSSSLLGCPSPMDTSKKMHQQEHSRNRALLLL